MKYVIFLIVLILILGSAGIFLINKYRQQSSSEPPHAKIQSKISQPHSSIQISVGKTPDIPLQLSAGFTIHIFASGLGNPRDLQFSPGGTLLVSDPNANQVYALPDKNQDGVADENKVIISNENHVHGLAFYQESLYIADVDKVVRYNWDEQNLTATHGKVLFTLPENQDHNSRTIIFNQQGQLFISVGSTCNVCNEAPKQGGSVWVSDANGNNPQIFATGLRNASFLTINPATDELWGTEMGRDYLGDTIPPDEINIIKQGNNYGWPNCYGDKIQDINFDRSSTDPCSNTTAPIFQIPAHSAPLGLTFINSLQFPSDWQGDLLVAYHGSWNRSTPIGYKVVHLKVSGNTITNSEDFLKGFAPASTLDTPGNSVNSASGRPADLIFDSQGNLYVSDDKAGVIYIIQKNNQ